MPIAQLLLLIILFLLFYAPDRGGDAEDTVKAQEGHQYVGYPHITAIW